MPQAPVYYPVTWQKQENLYCLPADQAKNLLKNKALHDGYTKELEEILKGLQ